MEYNNITDKDAKLSLANNYNFNFDYSTVGNPPFSYFCFAVQQLYGNVWSLIPRYGVYCALMQSLFTKKKKNIIIIIIKINKY